MEEDTRCFDCQYMGCDNEGHYDQWTLREDFGQGVVELICDCECHEEYRLTHASDNEMCS